MGPESTIHRRAEGKGRGLGHMAPSRTTACNHDGLALALHPPRKHDPEAADPPRRDHAP